MLQKVATTGVDLDSVYAQTLQRIREQEDDRSKLGMEVLAWVSHSERPLRITELRHALAVEAESTDLDPDNIRPQDIVLGSCLGLVVADEETSTVRLIHYTLQEYLSGAGILPDAHKTLAQTCLAYLNYEKVKRLPVDKAPNLGDMPFLEYSSLYWGSHAKAALLDSTKQPALELLNGYNSHISSTLLGNYIERYNSSSLTHYPFTGLHCASYFGMVQAVAALIEMKDCDINQRDCMGFTPLMWAARQGNEEVVRLLLTRDDVDPKIPDNLGQTPLWWASFSGHSGVVRLLLTRDDIDPNKPDNLDQTPLWWASFFGNTEVAKILLTRDDVNPNKPDHLSQTPLWWASFFGYDEMVRLLLTRDDVDPNKPDRLGQTPLWWASHRGHGEVVRILLAREDNDPNKPDKLDQTPLWWASFFGHDEVVRLLLTREDVNPNKQDRLGQTPLWWASHGGHGGVVRLLLTRNDVDRNKPGNTGETPLVVASTHGHREIVALLQPRATAIKPRSCVHAIWVHLGRGWVRLGWVQKLGVWVGRVSRRQNSVKK